MRIRANKNYVASDHAQRENVPRHILCYHIGMHTKFLADTAYWKLCRL